MAENTVILRLDNISKSFAKVKHDGVTHVLNEANLSVKSGEFISPVGPSGCGKPTMLRLVTGLIPLTTGCLTVNGAQTTGPSPERRMIFQEPAPLPWLIVEKDVSSSLGLQGELKENKEEVERMLKTIGLESFRNDYPEQLSGGMAQRVSLVRSLINEPDILLLGEPLGALDAFARMNIQDGILKVWQKKKQLAFMVVRNVDETVYIGAWVVVTDAYPGQVVSGIRIDQIYPRGRSSWTFVVCQNEILNRLHLGGKNGGQW